MMFRDQVGVLSSWFKAWNECEQTVALLSLLKRVSRTQARFLQLCLDHSLAACTELQSFEREANDPAYVGQWWQESHNKAMALLLSHFPLLKPSNVEAKAQYMRLLPKVLAHCIESGQQVEESRQLLSYALIHPAISMEDRGALAGWFSHLEDRVGTMGASTSFSPEQTDLPGFGLDCQSQQTPGATGKPNGWSSHRAESGWPEGAQTSETSQQSLSSSVSSSYSNSGNTNTSLTQRSASLTPPVSLATTNHGGIPASQPPHLDWLSQGPPFPSSTGTSVGGDTVSLPPHAPLSPQSSVASSGSGGSELADDFISIPGSGRNTFREEGSGMKDVPAWLKSLRLHKYARLFSQLTYPEMMSLTEQKLETQNVTKGARHKIVLSIMKLKERPQTLQSLEKDVLEGGNIRNALTELHQVTGTPIPTNMTCPGAVGVMGSNEALLGVVTDSGSPGQTASIVDLPGQITRVVGKVCTQLLVSRPDEENVASYLQLLDKCLAHEAFTETQKKRLLSWKQQVQKLFRGFPRKPMEIRQPGRSWSLFGQPLQLPPGAPMVGFGVGGMAWRGQRALPLPPRNIANTARLGLLATNPRPSALSKAVWYGASGGSNSMPSRNHSSVQRTRSLPVHTSPNAFMLFQQTEFQVPVTEPEINNRLESLCLSMMEHALGDGVDRTSTI